MHCEQARLRVSGLVDNELLHGQELAMTCQIESCPDCVLLADDERQIVQHVASDIGTPRSGSPEKLARASSELSVSQPDASGPCTEQLYCSSRWACPASRKLAASTLGKLALSYLPKQIRSRPARRLRPGSVAKAHHVGAIALGSACFGKVRDLRQVPSASGSSTPWSG
jgi:hypothetical protein